MTTELDLSTLAADVGDDPDDAVSATGLGTRGGADPAGRPVRAPSGLVQVSPEEMTIRCGAGTPVDDVQAALAEVGQEVALPPGGTVGGALAVGQSDVLRLGRGPVRDVLLQARYVNAGGQVVKAGGPTVKNVSGFDLCRLLVGSRGTLGVLGEVILRTRPIPTSRRGSSPNMRPTISWSGSTGRHRSCGTALPVGCVWRATRWTWPWRRPAWTCTRWTGRPTSPPPTGGRYARRSSLVGRDRAVRGRGGRRGGAPRRPGPARAPHRSRSGSADQRLRREFDPAGRFSATSLAG
jgi:hypothetical protein